jgi:hypothetical protein
MLYNNQFRVCVIGDHEARHTTILLGDSIGGQWFPALGTFVRPDWKLLVITKSSCPMIDKPVFNRHLNREYTECAEWRNKALRYVSEQRPDLVIVSSAQGYGLDSSEWREGARAVLEVLSPNAGMVSWIRTTPSLPFHAILCLGNTSRLTQFLADPDRCRSPWDDTQNATFHAALQEAARPFANVHLVDMNDLICPQNECRAERDEHVLFRDEQHLTASFVESLSDDLIQRMEAAIAPPPPGQSGHEQ